MTVQEAVVLQRQCNITCSATATLSFCTWVVHRAEVTSPRCGVLGLLVVPRLSLLGLNACHPADTRVGDDPCECSYS